MKIIRKITRVKLEVNQINDFILLGLVSTEPDYKLSLALNKKFKISLKNTSPIKITDNNRSELVFSKFSFIDGSNEKIFNLISNRSGKQFLIKKLKNIDYIFHIQNSDYENNISQITSDLREITSVTAVFNIDTDSVKDKNLHLIIQ
jgi:hypothetical protein